MKESVKKNLSSERNYFVSMDNIAKYLGITDVKQLVRIFFLQMFLFMVIMTLRVPISSPGPLGSCEWASSTSQKSSKVIRW